MATPSATSQGRRGTGGASWWNAAKARTSSPAMVEIVGQALWGRAGAQSPGGRQPVDPAGQPERRSRLDRRRGGVDEQPHQGHQPHGLAPGPRAERRVGGAQAQPDRQGGDAGHLRPAGAAVVGEVLGGLGVVAGHALQEGGHHVLLPQLAVGGGQQRSKHQPVTLLQPVHAPPRAWAACRTRSRRAAARALAAWRSASAARARLPGSVSR